MSRATNRALKSHPGARHFGAKLANAWRSQAPWFARSHALALGLILLAGGEAPANGQRRDEAPPAVTAANGPVATAIIEASQRFAIPQNWIAAVLQAESGGNVHAVSAKGALGLMQLMPPTWTQLRASLNLGADAFDPHDNIIAGASYLRQMLDRYGTSGFLAAYNVGPGRYDDYLATGKPLPDETRAYMARLAASLHLPQPGAGQTVSLDSRRSQPSSNVNASTWSSAPNDDHTQTGQTFALAPQANGLFVATPTASERQ